jgi:hypothetical protein
MAGAQMRLSTGWQLKSVLADHEDQKKLEQPDGDDD